jgi:hypothetical protein
MALLF